MLKSIAQGVLDNFDFDRAIEVIERYGNASIANQIKGMNQTSFTEGKLIRELERIQELPDPAQLDAEPSPVFTPEEPASDQPTLDLRQKRNETVKKRDFLKGQLELLPSDAERLAVALEILALSDHLNELWDDIRYVQANGELPAQDPQDDLSKVFEGVTNAIQLTKIIQNHKTYLSKARKGSRPADKIPFFEAVIREGERRANAI